MKLLALTKYGAQAASTRQRFLQYAQPLAEAGFTLEAAPLLDDSHLRRIVRGERASPFEVMQAYARRMRTIFGAARQADICWVHYEAFPYLPSLAERLAAHLVRPYVVDYDDAIFHMYDRNPVLRGKLGPIIAGASAVTAGNAYLADYAQRWNDNVHIIPTVVDTDAYMARDGEEMRQPPVLGWIGSPSTWAYVRPMLPLLSELCSEGAARFVVVGAGKAAEADGFEGLEFRDWAEHREIADVQSMDIGIMPLPDERWARGKCGYKLIQYMACALPSVASPVGVNGDIVVDGHTGFLATSQSEWRDALVRLLAAPELRAAMGHAARKRAVERYSLQSQAPRVVELFRSLLPK